VCFGISVPLRAQRLPVCFVKSIAKRDRETERKREREEGGVKIKEGVILTGDHESMT